MKLPVFTDWRLSAGAALDRRWIPLLCAAALAALVLSALALWRHPHRPSAGRMALLLGLRAAAIALCLLVALQPTLDLAQVARIPNHVAVLVDNSRSMSVRPADGGPPRYERAATLLRGAEPLFAQWRRDGHRVDLFSFGEAVAPTTIEGVRAPPTGEATRIGEALSELRARYAGRDLGAVVLVSDGIDTGRLGRGPADAETRATLSALGAPLHTVLVDEPEIKDLSIAAVLADDFAFVRTPIKLEAVVRQSGLGQRRVEVTLARDGRLVDSQTVLLEGDRSEVKVSFPFTPDHPGNFVFEIATPVLSGEALPNNNRQVFTIRVIRDRVRVLHVCGRPSWHERFLRSLLRLNPNVDLVSFFILRTDTDEQPNPREFSLIPFPHAEVFDEQLASFDLLIFDNFNFKPYELGPYLPGLRDYVVGGGALAMVGGELSFASGLYGSTPLAEVLPVDLTGIPPYGEAALGTERFRPKLTREGAAHPVTALSLETRANEARWAALPPVEGWNKVAGLRPGASALLVHPTQKSADGKPAPLVAVTDAGKGRTMALLTDTAWHWGFLAAGAGQDQGAGEDGRAFQRFWDSAIRWLVHDPALTLLRLELERDQVRRGQPLGVRVRALHADYTPAADVAVRVTVTPAEAPEGSKPLSEHRLTTNRDGEGHLVLSPGTPGAFRVAGVATIDGRAQTESKTFVVNAEGRELEDVVSRDTVLRELSTLTGGTFARELGDVPLRALREERVGSQRSIEVWSHPLVLLGALGLLLAEWWLRRRAGYA